MFARACLFARWCGRVESVESRFTSDMHLRFSLRTPAEIDRFAVREALTFGAVSLKHSAASAHEKRYRRSCFVDFYWCDNQILLIL